MSAFEVTPARLQSLAGQLTGLLSELEQAACSIRADAAGAAQNGQLEGAINGFLNDWSTALDSLQAKLSELGRRLETAGAAYQSTESELVSDLRTV